MPGFIRFDPFMVCVAIALHGRDDSRGAQAPLRAPRGG
jgi:hypothetical protein